MGAILFATVHRQREWHEHAIACWRQRRFCLKATVGLSF
jgi:hypothetical protein